MATRLSTALHLPKLKMIQEYNASLCSKSVKPSPINRYSSLMIGLYPVILLSYFSVSQDRQDFRSDFSTFARGTSAQEQFIPIQNEDEHNSEAESLAIKEFNLSYSVQLHIHLVSPYSKWLYKIIYTLNLLKVLSCLESL